MKPYRDQPGAPGARGENYFAGKLGLFRESRKVLTASQAFYGVSICLLNRQASEHPSLASEIEAVLLDVELAQTGAFNRRWLREMHLIESGSYTRNFP